jgi:hypothetical protein
MIKDIQKLKIWPFLEKNGFKPINADQPFLFGIGAHLTTNILSGMCIYLHNLGDGWRWSLEIRIMGKIYYFKLHTANELTKIIPKKLEEYKKNMKKYIQ